MNSRLKNFGFGKRKSSATGQPPGTPAESIASNRPLTSSQTPPPQISHSGVRTSFHGGPAASIHSVSSHQSLPVMSHPNAGPRPPSYTQQPGQFPPGPGGQPIGRTSPMAQQGPTRAPPSQIIGGPPPINTGAPVMGFPPPNPNMQGGPAPPGYGGPQGYPPPNAGPPPPGPGMPYGRPAPPGVNAAEVEGSSRSKAQLIVGIDFVSCTHPLICIVIVTTREHSQKKP